MMELLGHIQEVELLYPPVAGEPRPRIATCLTRMEAEEQKVYEALKLSRYLRA